jgi:pimeloyl-ACP methyl ester carboxylesterase
MYYGLNKTLRELFLAPERVPHLIVMGEQDHLFRDEAKRYAQERQRVRFEVVPKCGHVVSIERAEQFNRLCLEHLAQHAASKTL